MGLQDTSLSFIQNRESIFSIKEFFIFTSGGMLILNSKFLRHSLSDDPNCKKILTLVFKHLRRMSKKIFLFHRIKSNNFSFQKIYYNNMKLVFLIKDGVVYVSLSANTTKSHYIKLFLIHMCVAFINFNGVLVENIKNLTSNENVEELDFSRSEFFQLKIYELYFVKHITNHFDRVFKFLVNKEEMYLSYIKFKNMYVLDLSSGEIIFDILALRNSNKNKKIYKNEKLWQEIIHHSKNLMENYKNDFGNTYDNKDGFFRFVKFECTSTYPRLTFIIKYLPILKGISIIHMYSQKKLSRMSENTDNHITSKGYKEIDLLYGSDVKNNTNIEFRYTEPKKLQEIEKFFVEFFISIRSNSDIYHDINHELKYFDYTIITSINEILVAHREIITKEVNDNVVQAKITSIDSLIAKINSKLFENYLNTKNNGAEKISNEKPVEILGVIERDSNNSYNFLLIKKENILHELFNKGEMCNVSINSNNMNKSKSEQEVEIQDTKKVNQYIEHEDGWAVRTKTNAFFNNSDNKKHNSVTKLNKTNTINSNKTINFSKTEFQNNGVGGKNYLFLDGSIDFSHKYSNIIKVEDDSLVFNNREENEQEEKFNSDSVQTIDYLLSEFDNKNKNMLEGKLNDYFINDIPRHNVLESLIKQTAGSKNESYISNNNSKMAKFNFNLNLNIPLSNLNTSNNIGSKTTVNKVNNNFFRKETTMTNNNNNKLTLLDSPEPKNRNIYKYKTRVSSIQVENVMKKDNLEVSSLNNLQMPEYVKVAKSNFNQQKTDRLHHSREVVLDTNNKLVIENEH